MWLVNTAHNKNNKIRLPLISRWLTLFSLILSHNVNKNFLHKTPYFKKPKANPTLRRGFHSNFLSFSRLYWMLTPTPSKASLWLHQELDQCFMPRAKIIFIKLKHCQNLSSAFPALCAHPSHSCARRQAPRSPPARCQWHTQENETSPAAQQVLLHHWLRLHHPNPFNPSSSRGLPRTKSCI